MRRKLLYVLLVPVFALAACNGPDAGEIGVVRNGGPQDNHNIREGDGGIQCPGTKTRWNGWGSDLHTYPDSSSQRIFKFNGDRNSDAGPITDLRTADGYKVTLPGTIYFKTKFDCTAEGRRLVRRFDQANANRPAGERPWEDWPAWLAAMWKPILDRSARNVILELECKQVVSSCALLSRNATEKDIKSVDNLTTVKAIESSIGTTLSDQLKQKLGDTFFTDIQVNMEQPRLPDIDDAIAQAQQAYKSVADARAERLRQQELVRVERQKKKVNLQKQKGYFRCPSCARQDELRALPRFTEGGTNQTLVLGNAPVAIGNNRTP